jgi:hypothetical protein
MYLFDLTQDLIISYEIVDLTGDNGDTLGTAGHVMARSPIIDLTGATTWADHGVSPFYNHADPDHLSNLIYLPFTPTDPLPEDDSDDDDDPDDSDVNVGDDNSDITGVDDSRDSGHGDAVINDDAMVVDLFNAYTSSVHEQYNNSSRAINSVRRVRARRLGLVYIPDPDTVDIRRPPASYTPNGTVPSFHEVWGAFYFAEFLETQMDEWHVYLVRGSIFDSFNDKVCCARAA